MPLEAADIQALATALQNLQPNQSPAQVNPTAVKLPSFWQGNPEVWFIQVESIFTTRNPAVTMQQTKFEYVIQALDNSTAERGQNIILDPATLFKALFLAQLPPNVRRILSTLSKTEIADLALEAD